MKEKKQNRLEYNKILILLVLSFAGILFAGYLTYEKLFAGICVFSEGCSYFLGLPTCLVGLVLYSLIFLTLTISLLFKKYYRKIVSIVSFCGILFSGYFSLYEIFLSNINMFNGASYSLFFPSCFYGFLMFIVVFYISTKK